MDAQNIPGMIRGWKHALAMMALGGTAVAQDLPVRLITLDPGHFHAALVQKDMYPQVDATVHVYAPEGPDVKSHLEKITDFNQRAANPTRWKEEVYTGPDFLERMVKDHAGNVVVIAGNNLRKTEYIHAAIDAGFNVLADKPMAITPKDFVRLTETFELAAQKKALLYDIMTERYEINSILQRELMMCPEVFGKLQEGTPSQPAVIMESVHYFFKQVAGKPLIRPAWFFDVRQEGEAVPDVGTHLVDLVQWQCFPERVLNWRKDVKVRNARRWATPLTREQFGRVTGEKDFPKFLRENVDAQDVLQVFANGEVNYALRKVNVRVIARWDFSPPSGGRDSLFALVRGSKANLVISQGAEQHYSPVLYVENNSSASADAFERNLQTAIGKLSDRYPGLGVHREGMHWRIEIPEKFAVGHESHFAQVTERFLQYLSKGALPEWEAPNMLTKYFTTTEAYRLSRASNVSDR